MRIAAASLCALALACAAAKPAPQAAQAPRAPVPLDEYLKARRYGALSLEMSFSHDGRLAAFQSDAGGRLDLWVKPLDGGPARQVTRVEGFIGVAGMAGAPTRLTGDSAAALHLADGFQLGDHLEVLGAARGPLDVDELVQAKHGAAGAEQLQLGRVPHQLVVTSSTGYLAEQIDPTQVGDQGEVETRAERGFVQNEREARRSAPQIRTVR
ncbi:MAG TPA: hypothetical protein VF973_05510 [Myxococcales bacterium]